ncbi:MAG: family hydrolase [Firmicutes bacterium]|nr:family hydrolase [Bacillota bacterium]
MKETIADYIKGKAFLVCVDSDGCAMDTMEVKHRKCFAPKAIEVWQLYDIETKFLDTWNTLNLYSKTRGINRFKGLVKTFKLLATEGFKMPDLSAVDQWVQTTEELSNPSLKRAIEKTGDEQLINTLAWSEAVNQAIRDLPQNDKPFPNVKEGLKRISELADIAIVSSANTSAVKDEWTRHELTPYVEVLLGQESGSKAACIGGLKGNNFSDNKVLMVGDAPGDLEAALTNGVLYYPILVGREGFSWSRLASEGLVKLVEGSYRGEYQQKLINEFEATLK